MQAQLTCFPDNKIIKVSDQETILHATLRSGIPHIHACGGKAQCSTCRVQILKGLENVNARNHAEYTIAQKLHLPDNIRLACQTQIKGDVIIRRPVLDELDRSLVQTQVESARSIGEEKTIAILFSDIVAYTPFAESVSPYDTIHVLNRYFRLMGEVIQKQHGRISDYVGDGIMALFGVDDSSSAVNAAFEMFGALPELNVYLMHMFNKQFQIRVGIHYGKVVIGHVGMDSMSKLVAVGDAVNLASRIENKNKELGTHFLISEDAFKQITDMIQPEREHTVQVKGKKGYYKVYEVDPSKQLSMYTPVPHVGIAEFLECQ